MVGDGLDGEDVPGVGGDYPSTTLRTGCGGDEQPRAALPRFSTPPNNQDLYITL